ncbi:hypothetical protein K488DRAFT_45811 [Vararia minispora EC-137]|uniref:Uncharacterized protein n=1 Tax=Vararia minispora EC-137 TaxID=1314806 RepID=A0ACB8QRJ7_9AGAM|nr:hypothetical protein K488DRAFT_45811 [Vararia minispora EC-137]
MGFCRRCGDIVSGPRCKCGGAPVEAVLRWNQGGEKKPITDRWSQTYVARHSARAKPVQPGSAPASAAQTFQHFPKLMSTRVSAHIVSTTASRPTSPLKYSSSHDDDMTIGADILPTPGGGTELAKVYGSVLQSKDSLDSYHCHSCLIPFPPDATLYPDPADKLGARFFCRSCFVDNGGSRGECAQCHRPVLILKSEGGFVENGGHVWHKRCFSCTGCGKDIGGSPMVDLLGKPSCAACFETCLIRGDDSPRSRRVSTPNRTPTRKDTNSLGGTRLDSGQSRQNSPALEELEQRLGIRSRESTPTKEVVSPQPRFPVSTPKVPGSPEPEKDPSSPHGTSGASLRRKSLFEDGEGLVIASARTGVSETGSPVRRSRTPRTSLISVSTPSPKPTQDAIEEMKRRFLRQDSPSSPALSASQNASPAAPHAMQGDLSDNFSDDSPLRRLSHRRSLDFSGSSSRSPQNSTPPLSKKSSSTSLGGHPGVPASLPPSFIPPPFVPRTPDLMSDISDNSTSSAPPSPPFNAVPRHADTNKSLVSGGIGVFGTDRPSVQLVTKSLDSSRPSLTPALDTTCAKCSLPLFSLSSAGRYVTVPEPSSSGTPPRMYHTDCFRCRICDGVFDEKERGQAVFVRGVKGACHLECAPAEKMAVRSVANTVFTPPTATTPVAPKSSRTATRKSSPSSINTQSSRYSAPLRSAPSSKITFTRFGSSTSCPGCHLSVSPMERGVVPGPQGTRWHCSCLVCGGREARGRNGRRRDGRPGCGKQLDSSAKHDAEKGFWCRECLMPPVRSVLPKNMPTSNSIASHNVFPKLAAQTTGATTIARQFTGVSGGGDSALVRQMTGGGLSPTRQLTSSPTKSLNRQHTGGSATGGSHIRPRPKSVIGMRDEGRGMFLVRQMTGGAL